MQVNTLEDKDNPIRAIFAVQKLNEGWDVLNLFDIVRCYEARDSGKNRIGKTTISEAQLIGRGARYFPFYSTRFNQTGSAESLMKNSTMNCACWKNCITTVFTIHATSLKSKLHSLSKV